MDSERLARLREMGLSPTWQLRAAPAAIAMAGNAAIAGADVVASAVDASAVDASAVDASAVDASAVDASASASPDDVRRQSIALLDWSALIPSIAACEACALCKTRRHTVPGVGNTSAQWMFVGEAPGADEDAQGEPFVGQGGKLLDNMLKAIGLNRGKNVFIANVLKCRPPNNRNPEPGEVAKCAPYLERQLELIKPRLIVALGRFAAMSMLDTDATVASLRGRLHRYRGVPLIVTYHPAYLLRTLPEKAKAWEDLVFARRTFAALQNNEPTPS